MHPNPIFRKKPDEHNVAFVRDRAFGTLAINGADGPLTASIPILLSKDGAEIEFHLVRANPIAEALENETAAVLLVNGPDSYVSPDWYGVDDQVPTWNYVSVRIEGVAKCVDENELLPMLDRLSHHFEERLAPKPPWQTQKMDETILKRMMRAIVPCKLAVSAIRSTWKLNQNKPGDVRLRAAESIATLGIGLSVEELARLMTKET